MKTLTGTYPAKIKTFGNSMFPLLHNGDVVYLKKTAFSRLRVNDIICFRKYGVFQTHRIIYRTPTYVITKGDNNLKADGRVYQRQIVGRVYQVKRDGQIFNPEDIYLLQSTLYFQEIVKIKKAFEKAGIDFVFLKGLPLHLYYEKTYPRRIYADCDILIEREQFKTVAALLVKNRYKQNAIRENIKLEEFAKSISEISYFRTVNGYQIIFDIHLEVAFLTIKSGKFNKLYSQDMVTILTKKFLMEKKAVSVYKENFYILSPDNLILFLSLHFFHHNFKGIQRLSLLAAVIRANRLVSNKPLLNDLQKKIISHRLQGFILPSFIALKRLFDIKLPQHFIASLETNKINENKILETVFKEDDLLKDEAIRFINLFRLSSAPLYKKLLVFFNPEVGRSIIKTPRKLLFKRF